jgi:hypothetical protein
MEETLKSDRDLIKDLWEEHLATPFPVGFGAKDVNGIDFVMLDADIAGCVSAFISRGNLNLKQAARLGLCYHDSLFVMSVINEKGQEYFWRLGRLAELVLKAIWLTDPRDAKQSSKNE